MMRYDNTVFKQFLSQQQICFPASYTDTRMVNKRVSVSVGSQDSKAWKKIMEIICWLPNSISLVSAEGTDMDFKAGLWVAKSKHEKNVMTLRQTLSLQVVKI